ncbi:hypothetical protein ACIA8R_29630 [Nonomuraea sp. NPDC051191]|uniref:hypothetical protein n=1 Tax=Nonomuraea sp. NPDC051191 TaxID=3364372 RepID=UPI0037901DD5
MIDRTAAGMPVPAILARTAEAVYQQLIFRRHAGSEGGMRLEHINVNPRTDWRRGILLGRVHDTMRGDPIWRMLNHKRQWTMMRKNLCQVCRRSAVIPETGRISYVVTKTNFVASEVDRLTNAPPTCRDCISLSLEWCPQLQNSSTAYTVARTEPAGVLADLFRPGVLGPVREAKNVFVGWDEFARHPVALAKQMVVHLVDMQAADLPLAVTR